MSKIDKLSILGVRSFDNRVAETIQFYAPLTLIVGLNGSGKTTIIECLKYVTTGELPPNSTRGGAFIHDPQLCGEKEVLAQVKMSFKSTSGVRMVATRNMQLTVKKTTRSQKTLEGQLQMMKDGERTSISTRVAELDQMLPQYLGVSKAILEYVIFCHQEESLWPLSEPAALKKRFDEIFEAMKYTKAIENIKQLKKKQTEELSKYKIIEQHTKEDKDKADRDQRRMNVLYEEIEIMREKALALNDEVNKAKKKSEDAWEMAAQFDSIIGKLNGKRIEAQAHQKSLEELKLYMREMADSDEELEMMLNQYEDRLAVYEEDVSQLQRQHAELSTHLFNARNDQKARMTEIGRCKAERDEHLRQISHREELVKTLAAKHEIAGYDSNLTDIQVRNFITQIERLCRDKQVELDRARRSNQENVERAQRELNELSEKRTMLNQKRESHKAVIATNEAKISDLRRQINQINIDVGTKAKLESNIEEIETKLERAKATIAAEKFEDRIAGLDEQLKQLDIRKDALDGELLQATKQAGDTAKLDYLQKELKERLVSLETMIQTHQDQLDIVLGGHFEVEALEQAFQHTVDTKSSAFRAAEVELNAVQREHRELKYKLQNTIAESEKRKGELARHEKLIRDVLEPGQEISEFPDVIQKLSRSLEIVKTDSSNFAEMRNWYEKCLQTVQGQGICRLCQQNVREGRDRSAFVQRLEKQIARATAVALEEDIKEVEEEWARADAVRTNFDAWKRISEQELPAMEKQLAELQTGSDELERRIETHEAALTRARAAKQEVESVAKTVQTIVKYHTEVQNLQSQVESLSQRTQQAGLSRSLTNIQEDLKQLNEKVKDLKTSLADLTAQQAQSNGEVNLLELEARDVKSKLNETIHKLERKSSLEGYVNEYTSANAAQLATIQECDAEIQTLLPKFSVSQARLDQARRAGMESEREIQTDVNRLTESNNQIRHVDQQIQAYFDRGGERELEKAKRELDVIESRVAKIEQEQGEITDEIKKLEAQTRSFADTKREITDNLRYREAKRQLESVRREISELEARNAETDKERYSAEGTRWSNERNRLAAEQASVMGELKSKDNQLQELIQVWEHDYKDSAYKFREAHIKVETTKAAVEDLSRYGGALDQAIMKYHSIKMEEINRIIEELWKKTYQGTDVDTIMIKSDSENLKGNKSYNYRVVMVKSDAEMDMRGRCSAGQKVLASIIIRLALAECFGVNCGLIALDEPTTNLDSENIRALAQSLHEIIRIRRQQTNFQLIVITHDEEFLRAMQCADFADSYWRISRNAMMKSIIEKQRIAEVI